MLGAAKTGRSERLDSGDRRADRPAARGNDVQRAPAHVRRPDRIAEQSAHGSRQLARVAHDRERVRRAQQVAHLERVLQMRAGQDGRPSEAGSSRL